MSRCFPFPPPGYEKKIRIDETDTLTKEKRKEKKHKKSKKDKEKNEGKEKKDRERSKEEQREKKEKKEKHKDRKDKDRDKEKKRTSDGKKIEAQIDGQGREKIGTNILQNNNGNSEYVQDLERRIRDEEKATGSQIFQKIEIANRRNGGLPGRRVENDSCYPLLENNHKIEDDKRVVGGHRHFAVAKCSQNAVGGGIFGMDQKRVEGTAKLVEKKDVGKPMEGKGKTHLKGTEGKNDRPKDKDRDKKSEYKDKDRDKQKSWEEKMKEINKSSQEQSKFIEGGPRLKERDKDYLDTRNIKPPDILRASSNKKLAGEGNLGKRKELETNGFLPENGSRPNKSQKPVSSSLSAIENGRKLGSPQAPIKSTSEPQGVNNCKPEIKEHRMNGFIEPKKPKVVPMSSLAAIMQANENVEASVKLPHPDSKYLSEILSVPKRELPGFDEQEWLFGRTEMNLKKPKMDSSMVDEAQQVWDQALRIESADISALPYVIPY